MLHNISQFFSNNPWLNLIFLVLAVLAIVLAFIFYYKAKKQKLPTFSRKTTIVISRTVIKSNYLEVKYRGSQVDNLSITEVAFWNSGKETIRGIDIAPNDPLTIKTNNNIIYDFGLSFHDNVNNFQIQKLSESTLQVSFDFIDHNQGIKLKLYHSGSVSSDIEFSGTIIGAGNIKPGIQKGLIMNKLDILAYPSRKLTHSKNIILKIFGYAYGISIIPVYVAATIVLSPIDYIYEKIRNAHPKEFLLHD